MHNFLTHTIGRKEMVYHADDGISSFADIDSLIYEVADLYSISMLMSSLETFNVT